MTDTTNPQPPAETKRDRVRRVLFEPLGFRWPRSVDGAEGARILDQIADELSYMADDRLEVLRDVMRTKGEGGSRDFWPTRAAFVNFAEMVEPRPIEDLPALLSWFGSVEGPRAMAAGTLVETFEFIAARKVPPGPRAQKLISETAAENARRLQMVEDRQRQGLPPRDGEPDWARAYRARRAWCEEVVALERAKRGHAMPSESRP